MCICYAFIVLAEEEQQEESRMRSLLIQLEQHKQITSEVLD